MSTDPPPPETRHHEYSRSSCKCSHSQISRTESVHHERKSTTRSTTRNADVETSRKGSSECIENQHSPWRWWRTGWDRCRRVGRTTHDGTAHSTKSGTTSSAFWRSRFAFRSDLELVRSTWRPLMKWRPGPEERLLIWRGASEVRSSEKCLHCMDVCHGARHSWRTSRCSSLCRSASTCSWTHNWDIS